MILPLRWVLVVCDVFGLSHALPSAEVTVGTLGDYAVLCWDGEPILIKPRAEWRAAFDAWKPGFLQLKRE